MEGEKNVNQEMFSSTAHIATLVKQRFRALAAVTHHLQSSLREEASQKLQWDQEFLLSEASND